MSIWDQLTKPVPERNTGNEYQRKKMQEYRAKKKEKADGKRK